MDFTSLVLLSRPVIARTEKLSITEILLNRMLVCGFISSEVKQSDSVVIKRLVEDMESPLPGAFVMLKGTTIGTQTDFDRNFILTNPDFYSQLEGSLVCAYNGYEPLEIKINSNTKFVNGKFTEESYVILG